MAEGDIVFDRAIVEQMLLDDALDDRGGNAVIPDAVGIDEQDGALLAKAQAVRFGTKDAAGALRGRSIQFEFLEAILEIGPAFLTAFSVATFGFGGGCTDEKVALDVLISQRFDCFMQHGCYATWVLCNESVVPREC